MNKPDFPSGISDILDRPGAEWTWDEFSGVLDWLSSEPTITHLVRFAYSKLKDPATAEDVVQEVLVQRLRDKFYSYGQRKADAPKIIPNASKFWSWLFTCIHNEAIRHAKKDWRLATVPLDPSGPDGGWDPPTPAKDEPPYIAMTNEMIAAVRECVERLPEKPRRVIKMYYLEGRPQTEIAAVLGIKEPTVNQRVNRARRLLKPLLIARLGRE